MKYLTSILFACSAAILLLASGCQSKSERKLANAKYEAKREKEQTQKEREHGIVSPPGSSNLVSLGSRSSLKAISFWVEVNFVGKY